MNSDTAPALTDAQTAKFTKMARAIRKTLYVYDRGDGKLDATHSGHPRAACLAFHRDGTVTEFPRLTAADDHAAFLRMQEQVNAGIAKAAEDKQ